MKKFLLTIMYDGTNYCGWQVQNNALSVQSVVGSALENTVNCLSGGVTGCSRTDAGVHANMFCCHFSADTTIPAEKIPFALNRNLPPDISAVDCREVPNNFHARYSARGKNYIYKIYCSKQRNPFKDKYYLRYGRPIDTELLNTAAANFVGTHDFAAFCSAGSSVTDTVRTISNCSVEEENGDIIISVTGNGFLYNMVRIIVGTLLYVNEGKITPQQIGDIIKSKQRDKAGITVSPRGLYLNRVFYDEGDLKNV